MRAHLWISSWVLAAAGAALAASDDVNWTRFRGPDGSGVSGATTIPVRFTEKDCNWKVELPGKGHASPVVWGDKIFLLSSDEKTAARIVLCLRTSDGGLAWERRYESKSSRMNRDNSLASSTPAVDRDRVYVYFTTAEEVTVLALDHAGKDVWRRNLGPFKALHGSGTSPIVFDDLLVVGNDQEGPSSLIALDAATGTTRWQRERRTSSASYATPCVHRPDGEPSALIFSSTGHGLTSIDPRTGKDNWEVADLFPERVVGSPIVAAGLIVGSCGQGGAGRRFVAVRPGSPKAGAAAAFAYDITRNAPYVPTPLARGDLLFTLTDSGTAACLRAATGEKLWEERLNARFYASYVWAGGRLYAPSREGDLFVLAAGEKYELLARVPLGEPCFATAAIANGVMYLRTFKHLISIGGGSN